MSLDLGGDVVDLLQALIDIESVSGNEAALADAVEAALRGCAHLEVFRNGDAVVARTELGRAERVVIAGHLDTVPLSGEPNFPCRVEGTGTDRMLFGRGSCDMKGGVAVQLNVAAQVDQPVRDVTWVFYDNEEVDASRNGLLRLSRESPELLHGDFAVLCEPTSAQIEGGCQGTMRIDIETRGTAAHSARAWLGHNAIHEMSAILDRLSAYQPRQVEVEGLTYREGLKPVAKTRGIARNQKPHPGPV